MIIFNFIYLFNLACIYRVGTLCRVFYLCCFIESSNNPILHDNGIILPYIAGGEFKMQLKPPARINFKLELT